MKWHNRTLREMTSIKKRPVIQVCRKNTVRVGGSCSCKDPEVRPVCCPEETAEWLKALGRSRQAGHTAEPCGNLAKSCSPHYCVDVKLSTYRWPTWNTNFGPQIPTLRCWYIKRTLEAGR